MKIKFIPVTSIFLLKTNSLVNHFRGSKKFVKCPIIIIIKYDNVYCENESVSYFYVVFVCFIVKGIFFECCTWELEPPEKGSLVYLKIYAERFYG